MDAACAAPAHAPARDTESQTDRRGRTRWRPNGLSSVLLSDIIIVPFYAQFGFLPPLPELSVTYAGSISLHGATSRFVKDRDMRLVRPLHNVRTPTRRARKS